MRPALRERSQRRWLAHGAGTGDRPLSWHGKAPLFSGRRGVRPPGDLRVSRSRGHRLHHPAASQPRLAGQDRLSAEAGRATAARGATLLRQLRLSGAELEEPRRVVAKVEWHPGELCPRVGFIVTNLSRPVERVVAFYNQRGTAEQWIKEGKGAIKWTRFMPFLRCQRRPPSAPRPGLQPRQFHADAGNA